MSASKFLCTAALAALVAAACTTAPTPEELAIVAVAQENSILPATRAERELVDRQDLLSQATFWTREYEKNPNDAEAQFKLARSLRAIGSSQRATEIAAPALAMKPDNVELALIYAQACLDMGKPQDAAMALAAAEPAGQNDWRLMSIIGVVMDQLEQHKAARDYYAKALQLSPDNPKVLSNLGLSYALEGDPVSAEKVLRQALALPTADIRVRQNLVLVLGVQGKFEEAKTTAGPETPKFLVDANEAYFRALLTPGRNWDKLRAD
jgi:Flp pilus assembly protein TadD